MIDNIGFVIFVSDMRFNAICANFNKNPSGCCWQVHRSWHWECCISCVIAPLDIYWLLVNVLRNFQSLVSLHWARLREVLYIFKGSSFLQWNFEVLVLISLIPLGRMKHIFLLYSLFVKWVLRELAKHNVV